MKDRFGSSAPCCLLLAAITFTAPPSLLAQHEAGKVQGPDKYLYLTNVDLKADQNSAYGKLEADEVQAMRAVNAPSHYIGMWSITGANHVIYFHGFDSFADLQKNHETTMGLSKLMDTVRTDDASEAPLIADNHTSVYEYKEDLSLNAPLDLSKQRFMRIILFHIRSGQDENWEHVVKLFAKAYQSSIPEARWAMFEKMYGVGSDNVYILVTPMESLSAVDDMHDSSKKFEAAVGADQLQMLRKSLDATVESSEADLFALSPQLSYTPDSWITASPDFWGKK
jgi:hypothetical protein